MDVEKMLPDKTSDTWVVRDGVVAPFVSFEASCWSFDANVVHKRPGDMRDFGLQDKSDVFVEDSTSVSPAHR